MVLSGLGATEGGFWLFSAMGALHRALAALDVRAPPPIAAPYAPPRTVQRWLPVTEAAVQDDPEAVRIARLVRDCLRRLRRRCVPGTALPVHPVHGDVRLSNVRRLPTGETL